MTDFDRIAASAPVNAASARQMGIGIQWSPIVELQDYFPDRPPMKPESFYLAKSLRNGEWVDFRGKTFGRLTVLGVMEKAGNEPASWVCRCQCGGFCTRKAKSLKVAMRGGNSFVPMCGCCDYQRKLREGWAPMPKGWKIDKKGATA